MKIDEIRGKTKDQLVDLLHSLKRESLNLRFQKSNGELEKTSRIREVRRDIAKINTHLIELANDNVPQIKEKPKKAKAVETKKSSASKKKEDTKAESKAKAEKKEDKKEKDVKEASDA